VQRVASGENGKPGYDLFGARNEKPKRNAAQRNEAIKNVDIVTQKRK